MQRYEIASISAPASCLRKQVIVTLLCGKAGLFVLRFYGPVNPMGSCQARSVLPNQTLTGQVTVTLLCGK